MSICSSVCHTLSTSGNGGETVISYAGGKFYQTTKEQAPCLDAKAQSSGEKQVKEYAIVQKELEALQSQISHSQAVLASLKFTFLEASAIRKNLDKVNRTTQTLQDSQPKSLENVSASGVRDKGWQQLTSSCPAIVHNIAVQTEFVDVSKPTIINDAEYFLPPIGSPLDLKNLKDPRLGAPVDAPNSIDLDIYRSCRKLSVLPEEEATGDESPPGSRLAIARYPEQQSHSFESYLLPASIPQVIRQLSDPTTSRSTRRPLQVSTSVDAGSTEGRVGVQDSGLGSETRIPSPTFTTLQDTLTQLVTISYSSDPDLASVITLRTPVPMSPEAPYKTPPDITPSSPNQNSSSDTSLSFQTPTEITPGNESPIERLPLDRSPTSLPMPEKPMLSVLLDDKPLPPPPPQALDAPNEGPLRRVPSKRGKVPFVRSMARTDSKTALVVPSGEDSTSANGSSPTNGSAVNGCSSQSQTSITVPAPTTVTTPPSSEFFASGDAPIVELKSRLVHRQPPTYARSSTQSRTQEVTVESSSNDDNGLEMERQENQAVFPSLSDAALRQLGLWLQANNGDEREPQLTDVDVENKYTSLVLAFKTDKLTLTRRLELQNKLRDQAEINMTHEFEALKSVVQLLSSACIDAEKAEMFEKIRLQVETLYKATLRVSSTAEMYGAVQQENRLSKAVDIVLRHVDNLKQSYDKEKTEHEETKKLVQKETKPVSPAVSALKNSGKRRASIATLHQGQNQGEAVNASAVSKMYYYSSAGSLKSLKFTRVDTEEGQLITLQKCEVTYEKYEMPSKNRLPLDFLTGLEDGDYGRVLKAIAPKTLATIDVEGLRTAIEHLDGANVSKDRWEFLAYKRPTGMPMRVAYNRLIYLSQRCGWTGVEAAEATLRLKCLHLSDDPRVLETMLGLPSTSTSADMVNAGTIAESLRLTSGVITGCSAPAAPVSALKAHIKRQPQRSKPQTRQPLPHCAGCFSQHSLDECPFSTATCRACNKVGHLEAVCRSRKSGQGGSKQFYKRTGAAAVEEDRALVQEVSLEEKMLRRGSSSSRRGSRTQLRRANTHKEEFKAESHIEKGTEETLGDIREKVERRCSHIVYSDDQDGLSGTSQANSCSEGETETDDETFFRKQRMKMQNIEQIQGKRLPNRYKFRKRSSFCAPPWVLKIMAYLQWLQPYEDFAMQARYILAGIFVLTAIGIVLSNFFVSQES
ncbi:hypothetical protein GE061_005958 [Apolygus lucorum]|uniref:Uncharacterized protein n=1 Tax=Apolygus lucorum TaxID=248454 RepID=A0A8S9WRU8_APOLU|nr:hypothetical protein GE061_005958 [Apolygus lucorum]